MKKSSTVTHFSRRRFLQSAAVLGAAGCLPGISWATTATDNPNRLLLIILRGAMDGLSAVVPFSDSQLAALRSELLLPDNSLLKLDNHFALHPSFSSLYALHQQGELGILHATATPYRQRSHFDGQNVLESGLEQADKSASGWLNRAIAQNTQQQAMVIGQAIPLILRGEASTASWSPKVLPAVTENTLQRFMAMYEDDPYLGPRLQQAVYAQQIAGTGGAMGTQTAQTFPMLVDAAVNFLSAPENGPDLVVLESNGWDTHANQGNNGGQLANKFAELDDAINRIKLGMGSRWAKTAVVVITEFGRTVRVNGTAGTDHGTGGVAFVASGALARSSLQQTLLGDWEGLAENRLHEGRDVPATNDMRSLLKAVMHQHMGYNRQTLDEIVFPGSHNVSMIDGLF